MSSNFNESGNELAKPAIDLSVACFVIAAFAAITPTQAPSIKLQV